MELTKTEIKEQLRFWADNAEYEGEQKPTVKQLNYLASLIHRAGEVRLDLPKGADGNILLTRAKADELISELRGSVAGSAPRRATPRQARRSGGAVSRQAKSLARYSINRILFDIIRSIFRGRR